MKELNEKNKQLIIIGIVLLVVVLLGAGYWLFKMFFSPSEPVESGGSDVVITEVTNYDTKLIREINKTATSNYLISPYSIELALSMLRDGADGTTREEIEDLIGERDINILGIPGKVNVANAVFVNDEYKDSVVKSYYDTVTNKYKSDIIYDSLKTPEVINNWVNKETYQMIPKLFDKLPLNSIMVLVNALAIDVEWKYGFECKSTVKEEFTKADGTKTDVSMMVKNYKEGAKYFELDGAKGVILPYQSYDSKGNKVKKGGNNLEFIGILPDGDVKTYVNNLTSDKLNEIDDAAIKATDDQTLLLKLPKFTYDYAIEDLTEPLKDLGIKRVFVPGANLSNMTNEASHVSQAVHKTYIEVDENGTKAAAATGVVVTKDAMPITEKIVFDKPFAYIIRDKKTKEMLFFGVVYEPNKFKEQKCK